MKKYLEKIKFLGFILLILTIPSLPANAVIANNNSEVAPDVKVITSDLVGAWRYTVENVPPEYSEGVINISNENDKYVVQVQLGTGVLQGEKVSVDGNEINFRLLIEGGYVNVVLTADGDSISGKSTSSDGVYSIAGERVKTE